MNNKNLFPSIGSEALPMQAELDHTEIEELSLLLHSSETVGNNFEIFPVKDAGFVVRLGERPPIAGNDWALFDLDDTLIAYSKAKEARLAAYQEYAHATGLGIDTAASERLLDITDRFSRWQEGGAEMYHRDAHKAALAWATAELRGAPSHKLDERVEEIETRLAMIKGGASQADESNSDEPFHFVDNKLVIKKPGASQETLEGVFDVTVKVPSYGDALAAMAEIGSGPEDNHRVNVGIFTYGEPQFQLQKTLELLDSQSRLGERLPVSQIWLTRVPKGEFVEEVIEALDDQAETHQDGSIKEEIFNAAPHVLLLVDDSPKELDTFWRSEELSGDSQTYPAVLRTVREATKSEAEQWGMPGHNAYTSMLRGVFDATPEGSGDKLADDIYVHLLNNLSRLLDKNGDAIVDPEVAARVGARQTFYINKAQESSKPKYVVKPRP